MTVHGGPIRASESGRRFFVGFAEVGSWQSAGDSKRNAEQTLRTVPWPLAPGPWPLPFAVLRSL